VGELRRDEAEGESGMAARRVRWRHKRHKRRWIMDGVMIIGADRFIG